MSEVSKVRFEDYPSSIAKALDLIGAAGKLPQRGLVIIKPNLTTSDKPPTTTSAAAAEAVYRYCSSHCKAQIAIGEGCGSGTTRDAFEANGYVELARKYGIRLIDFNEAPSVTLRRTDALQLKELHVAKVAADAFIISLPVLKDHCFTTTTIAMKNMFGLASAPYYRGSYNKSKLHSSSVHKSVFDVCLYKRPDLCVVDASVAMTGNHLSGESRKLDLILASFDPVAVDAVGSRLLGHDPQRIEYLALANGILGDMDDILIVEG